MTKKKRPEETTELCTEMDNWVVMGNDLLKGKTALSATEVKLLRLVMMQIRIEDDELGAYVIKAKELAEMLGLDASNFTRDLQKTCYTLAEKTIKINTYNPKRPWKVLPWVGYIEYTEKADIIIQLNTWLAPYLFGLKLKGHYTQYVLENILRMNSYYAIRIYELLKMKLPNDSLPTGGTVVRLTNEEIRTATEIEKKYSQNIEFKRRVLDVAVKEINEKSDFVISYEQKKTSGRAYNVVDFTCKSRFDTGKEPTIVQQCKAKLVRYNQMRTKQGKKSIGMYDQIIKDLVMINGGIEFDSVEDFDMALMEYIADRG